MKNKILNILGIIGQLIPFFGVLIAMIIYVKTNRFSFIWRFNHWRILFQVYQVIIIIILVILAYKFGLI